MHSTFKLIASDPHDAISLAPDLAPATWADKVLADIRRDLGSQALDQQRPAPSTAAGPAVDAAFRAAPAGDIRIPDDQVAARRPTGSWAKSAVTVFLFALFSAFAAAGWQTYGDTARQMIADWAPSFTSASSPPSEKTMSAGPSDAPAVAAAATDPSPPSGTALAQPAESAIPATAAPTPDTAQSIQSMARDLAAMGQQVEQLKASIAELKASQQAMAAAKTSEVKPSETKPSEIRTSAPNPRPRMSAPPPRSAVAPARRPVAAYVPAQAAAPPPLPQAAPPASWQPAPPPPAAMEPDGEPVLRPPMPLH